MNAKLGQQMTILGLCAMAFYGLMLGTGTLSIEVMPQFVISAVIFLTSGQIMKKAARRLPAKEKKEIKRLTSEEDWPWLTALTNWVAAFMIIGLMAIFLMKPIGVPIGELIFGKMEQQHFSADSVP